jgi:D-arabinose 1-dehydrogenase-like Zn-dependent alcohol dehydrogenase
MPAADDQCFVSVVAAEKDLRKAVDSEEECASLVGDFRHAINRTVPLERAGDAYARMMRNEASFRIVITIGQ